MGEEGAPAAPPSGITDAADLILLPTQEPDRCLVERVHA
jgi:hypothetical protein